MRVALDPNRYVDLCKGVDETVTILEEAEAILLPFVVLGELRAGFAHGRRQAENEGTLRRPYPDQRHVTGRTGAAQHHLVLHARDRHFDHLPQLVRV